MATVADIAKSIALSSWRQARWFTGCSCMSVPKEYLATNRPQVGTCLWRAVLGTARHSQYIWCRRYGITGSEGHSWVMCGGSGGVHGGEGLWRAVLRTARHKQLSAWEPVAERNLLSGGKGKAESLATTVVTNPNRGELF